MSQYEAELDILKIERYSGKEQSPPENMAMRLSEVSQFIKTHFQCRLQACWLRERDFQGKNNTYNSVGMGFLGRFETVLAVDIYATFGASQSRAQRTAKKLFCSFYFSS